MSLFTNISKNAAWTAAGQWVNQLFQFGTIAVLAWLLTPQDYGLITMASTYTGFVILFANLGFGPALVQRDQIDSLYIDVAFTSTAASSLLLFLITYFIAPLVAWFYKEPALSPIIRISSLTLVFSPLNVILSHILMREMRFKELAFIDVISSAFAQFVAIIAAWRGLGVWSLVIAAVLYPAVRLPFLLNRTSHRPRFKFEKSRFKDLFSFGSNLMGFNFVNYISRNLDSIIIGKFLGPNPLGYYDRAYQIMLKPLQNISQTISQPLFAGLASLRDNKSEARDTYCKMVLAISLITFPIMLGLALVSSEFILTVFGPKWAPSIPILQILSIVGAFQSVGTTVGTIYQAQGRTDIMFRVGILCSVCYCATFIVGAQFGIFGVALSYGIVSTLLWVYTHWVANRLLDLPNKAFWKNLLPPTILSIGMSVPVIIAKLIMLKFGTPVLLSLAIQVITGGVTYLFLIYNSKHPDILTARLLVSSKLTGVFTLFHGKHPKVPRTNAHL